MALAPDIAPVAELAMVNLLVVVVVNTPLVSVRVPETEVAALKLTPALLLIVKLLAPVKPAPVTWAEEPLKV